MPNGPQPRRPPSTSHLLPTPARTYPIRPRPHSHCRQAASCRVSSTPNFLTSRPVDPPPNPLSSCVITRMTFRCVRYNALTPMALDERRTEGWGALAPQSLSYAPSRRRHLAFLPQEHHPVDVPTARRAEDRCGVIALAIVALTEVCQVCF